MIAYICILADEHIHLFSMMYMHIPVLKNNSKSWPVTIKRFSLIMQYWITFLIN